MKKCNKFSLTLFLISVCMAVLSVAARIFLTNSFIEKHGVYAHGTPLPTIYHILLTVAVLVLAAVPIIIGRKNIDSTLVKTGTLSVFTACFSAFMLVVYLFIAVYDISQSGVSPKIIDTMELIFAVPTVIFFFLTAFQKSSRTPALALTSLFPGIWTALGVIKIYFNMHLLMNNPDKILGEFALIAAMLFFMFEARNQIGIPFKGLYQAASLSAPILLFTASVPNLVCADKLSDGTTVSTIRYMVYIALALFMYARAVEYAVLPKEKIEVQQAE